ncbi:hypothetical protein SNE40_021611 [Patella caerulea]|uniref:Uncharacterized protein n=1 Tax=Patella caerulea TaxID=87958 RepID=A0AAN8G098_PATCE
MITYSVSELKSLNCDPTQYISPILCVVSEQFPELISADKNPLNSNCGVNNHIPVKISNKPRKRGKREVDFTNLVDFNNYKRCVNSNNHVQLNPPETVYNIETAIHSRPIKERFQKRVSSFEAN